MQNKTHMIASMIEKGVLRTPRIIEAFKAIDRAFFVPEPYRRLAYVDRPLPIGDAQTISQPSTVAFMLELLEPNEGHDILDIGSGSGWSTALLCHIVGKKGSVSGLEREKSLVEFGRKNLEKFFKTPRCKIEEAKGALGKPGLSFDRILVSASADRFPVRLTEQLKIGGSLVIPVRNSIVHVQKLSKGDVQTREYPGFAFVPLVID